jgi:hypothetical protein
MKIFAAVVLAICMTGCISQITTTDNQNTSDNSTVEGVKPLDANSLYTSDTTAIKDVVPYSGTSILID